MKFLLPKFLLLSSLAKFCTAQYTADWGSIDSRPLPEWYDQAKVGIFMHFGPYSVPAVQTEWFWYYTVTEPEGQCAKYMEDYCAPYATYQDFGSQLVMDFFDPDEMADIVASSGAKYLVFTSKHHDGFANWESTYAYGWNAMAIGPQRDVLQELKTSFAERHPEIHFGLYYSLYEWFNPIYLKDKGNNYTSREFPVDKMLPELTELINTLQPEVLWADGDWEAYPEYWGSLDFLAWLYNDSPVKDTVVTNDRWGIGCQMTHGGFYSGPDRYDPGTLQQHKWENAMTIDSYSWGYRRDINIEDVQSAQLLVEQIARAVSCGGNILINVGPTKEGTIAPIFQERLLQIGTWLGTNGDAIYETIPWAYQNDSTNGEVWYTKKDSSIYGIALFWPDDDVLELEDPEVIEGTTVITMLGWPDELTYSIDASSGNVLIEFPSMSKLEKECGEGCQWGYALKFDGLDNADEMPEYTTAAGGTEDGSNTTTDFAVTLGSNVFVITIFSLYAIISVY